MQRHVMERQNDPLNNVCSEGCPWYGTIIRRAMLHLMTLISVIC
uniref:Uncharacterized protein n=1 Tax=Arundo donax TaxID=35708 RepID=A0A0A9HKV6_ARUDO